MSLSKSFILFAILYLAVNSAEVPKIKVYVESLCPGCMGFVTGAFKTFNSNESRAQLAEVEILSYGNAYEKYDSQNKKWIFTCQHGQRECYGNLIETCADHYLGGGDKSHTFLICVEQYLSKNSYYNFDDLVRACVKADVASQIITCANNSEGNSLMHEVAQKTGAHKYVPWIEVNGVHDDNVQDAIYSNMVGYLCKIGGFIGKLPGCPKRMVEEETLKSSTEGYCPKEESHLKFLE